MSATMVALKIVLHSRAADLSRVEVPAEMVLQGPARQPPSGGAQAAIANRAAVICSWRVQAYCALDFFSTYCTVRLLGGGGACLARFQRIPLVS